MPENPLSNYSDFHGLYITTIDDRTATKNNLFFVKTMLENSMATKENVKKIKESRPSTREMRPSTAFTTIQYKNKLFKTNKEDENLQKNYESLFLKKDVSILFIISVAFILF